MLRILPILITVPLAVAFGIAEGLWTNRWTPSLELERAAARLAEVPMQLGEWEGHTLELDAKAVAIGEIAGYLRRTYTHKGTGTTITVLLVCGRPGPIAVHTPEVCFGGAGWNLVAAAQRRIIEAEAAASPAEFYTALFQQKRAAAPEQLRAYWSWTATGDWTAPDNPRLTFARSPVLYKLYVTRPLANLEEAAQQDACRDFLGLLLPELHRCLFSVSHPE